MDTNSNLAGVVRLHKEVVAVLNGYLPRRIVTQIDGCDVYIAEEWQTKQNVILKVGLRDDPHVRGELYFWKVLNCAHMVELSDYFCYEDFVYFVYPHFPNGSLHDLMTNGNAGSSIMINELIVRKWSKQIFIFLNRIHTMGIYHLNIRMKTLFINGDANLKVGGLGYLTTYNDRFALFGRMDHVAPEVLQVYPYSRGFDLSKVDMWAAGGLICQLLTGIFISGPAYGEALADRLNRRLVIRQNVELLASQIRLSRVSRGAKGFLTWLLKWEPAARPTARQALKHPWLRDQEIRTELYELDKVLNKVTGRVVKLVPQMSKTIPLVPLVPPHGPAYVRLHVRANSERQVRLFKLGMAEDKVHFSKHAWDFRDHVLEVDEARREMWAALYNILTTEGTRWHWQPLSQPMGRRYELPAKRIYPTIDTNETGDRPSSTFRVTSSSTRPALPTGSDESSSTISIPLGGGADTGLRYSLLDKRHCQVTQQRMPGGASSSLPPPLQLKGCEQRMPTANNQTEDSSNNERKRIRLKFPRLWIGEWNLC